MKTKKLIIKVTLFIMSGNVFFASLIGITGCDGGMTTHGAIKVAVCSTSPGGPWILTNDGAIFAYNGSAWDKKEPPGTADDFEICGNFLTILTKPDNQGKRVVKSREINGSNWTTYPAIGSLDLIQVDCHGKEPIVLAAKPDYGVYKYYNDSKSWKNIHNAATWISIENSQLFYLYPTSTAGNIWSRNVDGGLYNRWDEKMVADKIAGDANGFPWVATNASSNPLYKWDTQNQKWTFAFYSGPVYDMDIDSYIRMYILSDPKISGGGFTLYSHDLYSGDWTTYPLPSY